MKKFVLILFGSMLLILGNSCVVHTKPTAQSRTIVVKAPRNHKIVVIKGKRYYTWGGKHYKKTRKGYIITRV